jgi:Tol biopolymer transport system component
LTIAEGTYIRPAWSPDGTHFAVGLDLRRVAVVRLRDRSVRTFTIPGPDLNPTAGPPALQASWAPDGRRLVVGDSYRPGALVAVIDTRSRASRPLVAHTTDLMPRWSPDGRMLAYLRETALGDTELRVRPLGEPSRTIAHQVSTRYAYAPYAWSPDARAIAFVSTAGELMIATTDGARSTTLATDAATAAPDPTWSADASTLAYTTREGTIALIRADDSPSPLAPPPGAGSGAVWSPDGAGLAYIAHAEPQAMQSGEATLWTFATQLAQTLKVDPFRNFTTRVSFSPDGSKVQLTFGADYRNCSALVIAIPRASDSPLGSGICDGVWSPDSRAILWSSDGYMTPLEGTADGHVLYVSAVTGPGVAEQPMLILRRASDPSWQPLTK